MNEQDINTVKVDLTKIRERDLRRLELVASFERFTLERDAFSAGSYFYRTIQNQLDAISDELARIDGKYTGIVTDKTLIDLG